MEQTVTQGHGEKGNFGGLPLQYSKLSTSKIVVVPVPFDMTTSYQKGTDKGPAAIIEASRYLELYDIETDSEIYPLGIHTAKPIVAHSSKEMLKKTEETVSEYIAQGKFLVTLGGEHSISLAPIKAHMKTYAPFSVLHFDAHTDLQDAYMGDPYSHGSVMARVKELKNVGPIVSVGIRSMAQEEKKNLVRHNTFFAHNIHQDARWIEKILKRLSDRVYITFDLDVFDSSLMPSTGTPEPGGLFFHQVMPLLKEVCLFKEVIGLDVVELLPKIDNPAPDFLAAKLIYKTLSYIFSKD